MQVSDFFVRHGRQRGNSSQEAPPTVMVAVASQRNLNNCLEIFVGARINVTVLACHVQRLPKEIF